MASPEPFVLQTDMVISGVALPVRLGAWSWGRLNEARDNAVLVCHYYTGTMRAAGRNPDGTPAWWDALIGPDKAIDTNKFFVVCMNTPSNVQAGDPEVITTGPDTLAPDGQPWGERFPAWDFADLHALQLELMRQLGVGRWHAVVGPSLGGMQALQWAARSPELVGRVAAVAASPKAGPVLRQMFGPLLRDVAPTGGLEGTLRLISFFGFGADGIEELFRAANFSAYLRNRIGEASLAHVLDIGRVVTTHDLAVVAPAAELGARWQEAGLQVLTVNILGDLFFPAAEMRAFAEATRSAGAAHQHLEFSTVRGHMGCLLDTAQFAGALKDLLNLPVGAKVAAEVVRG